MSLTKCDKCGRTIQYEGQSHECELPVNNIVGNEVTDLGVDYDGAVSAGKNAWQCEHCGFWNKKDSLFCENCNEDSTPTESGKYKCRVQDAPDDIYTTILRFDAGNNQFYMIGAAINITARVIDWKKV